MIKSTNISFKIMLYLLVLLVLSSCKKQPTSDFTTDKIDYSAGEFVSLTSYSKDAKKYVWTVLNSSNTSISFEGEHPSYKVPTLGKDGNYTITLDTYSKKDKKKASSSREILVKTSRGFLTIRTQNNYGDFSVEIDNETAGKSNSGYYNIAVPIGLRYVIVSNSAKIWKYTVKITEGNYYTIYLD
jgi:hypothetical protein